MKMKLKNFIIILMYKNTFNIMIGNKWTSYTLRWVDEYGIFHRSNLSESEGKKEYEMLKLRKPYKAELIEVTHLETIKSTYYDNITKTDDNKRMLEEMQRNNKAVKQLCLLLGV